MITVHIVASTHAGSVRPFNEDAHGATSLVPSATDGEVTSVVVSHQPALAVVADGLGGLPCGEVASRVAVDSLLVAEPTDATSLVDAVHAANGAVVAEMQRRVNCVAMGTTIAAVLVHDQGVAVVNVGDSSVFELVDDRLVQLSVDDVPAGSSSLPGLPTSVVTQTLGGAMDLVPVEPHLYEEDPASRRLLLCTDGLTNFVPRDQIADALRRSDSEESVRVLIALALAAGAPDNVTVVRVDVALYGQESDSA